MRTVVALTPLLLLTFACSDPKVLNEKGARDLVSKEIERTHEKHVASVSNIEPLMQRTLKDYSATTATAGPEYILKKLIERKLVSEKPIIISYPAISGAFKTTTPYGFAGKFSEATFDLHTEPNSNIVRGIYTNKNPDSNELYEFEGEVQPDGMMQVRNVGKWYASFPILQYQETGATGRIVRKDNGLQYIGPASGKTTQKKFYEYSFTDDMQKLISDRQRGPLRQKGMFGELSGKFVPVGDFVLGEVSDLQLVMDNHAAANIAWEVSPNDLGQLFLGTESPKGKTEVHFVKKPDGTWVLASEEE